MTEVRSTLVSVWTPCNGSITAATQPGAGQIESRIRLRCAAYSSSLSTPCCLSASSSCRRDDASPCGGDMPADQSAHRERGLPRPTPARHRGAQTRVHQTPQWNHRSAPPRIQVARWPESDSRGCVTGRASRSRAAAGLALFSCRTLSNWATRSGFPAGAPVGTAPEAMEPLDKAPNVSPGTPPPVPYARLMFAKEFAPLAYCCRHCSAREWPRATPMRMNPPIETQMPAKSPRNPRSSA